MAKCEGKGALTQWKWHRMRRGFLRIESGLLACDNNNITVACEKTRTRLAKNSPLVIGMGTIISKDVRAGEIVVSSRQRTVATRDLELFYNLKQDKQYYGRYTKS